MSAGGWAQQNVTADLQAGKFLTGLRVWGYSGSGGTNITRYDDFVINAVPEPGSLVVLGAPIAALLLRRKRA